MSRPSARYRRDQAASQSSDPKVALFEFSHPDLPEPIRLCSAAIEVISRDPRTYGIRSAWRGEVAAYQHVACGVTLPGDQPDAPAAVSLTFDLFDASLPELLRSFSTRADCRVALVMASAPDVVEAQWGPLDLVSAQIGDRIVISANRKRIEEEGAPFLRFTRTMFPGLYR
ncbi:hypothetical protein [Salipiger abyssi]|uniref:Uncharacterized protein n=1 Tax=Salipiger abyssi TaxID=1250539 RepID=A0A1P8UUR7_9RHOB|nr:hypothetical protein [Salipiger abyssi]APZ53144.1 hypothetical protein Ga0080574_TMP2810 [Salipiger abyssi]